MRIMEGGNLVHEHNLDYDDTPFLTIPMFGQTTQRTMNPNIHIESSENGYSSPG